MVDGAQSLEERRLAEEGLARWIRWRAARAPIGRWMDYSMRVKFTEDGAVFEKERLVPSE